MQGRRFHNTSELNHCYSENIFPYTRSEFLAATYICCLLLFLSTSDYSLAISFQLQLMLLKTAIRYLFCPLFLRLSNSNSFSLSLYMYYRSWLSCWTCSSFSGISLCLRAPNWTLHSDETSYWIKGINQFPSSDGYTCWCT